MAIAALSISSADFSNLPAPIWKPVVGLLVTDQVAARQILACQTAVKLRLISQDPLACPRVIVLDQFPAEIGRGTDVALRIDDRWISRRHCRITLAGDEITVHDLGSRHGTYVNGAAIEKATLLPGNELCLGLSHFIVQMISDTSFAAHESGELEVAVGAARRSYALS